MTLCLRIYNSFFQTGEQMQSPIIMGSAVQCMDQAWGAIFIGTTSGHVARYHIKVTIFCLFKSNKAKDKKRKKYICNF